MTGIRAANGVQVLQLKNMGQTARVFARWGTRARRFRRFAVDHARKSLTPIQNGNERPGKLSGSDWGQSGCALPECRYHVSRKVPLFVQTNKQGLLSPKRHRHQSPNPVRSTQPPQIRHAWRPRSPQAQVCIAVLVCRASENPFRQATGLHHPAVKPCIRLNVCWWRCGAYPPWFSTTCANRIVCAQANDLALNLWETGTCSISATG